MVETPRFHANLVNDDLEAAYARLKVLVYEQIRGLS
jgi:hypothetical protein